MSPVRLVGSSSGFVTLDAPSSAGSNTLVLPTGNGTANQALVTDGSGNLSFADRGRMTLATAQNTTSGTSIDFTGIPSWVKRVTVMFNGVSTNGTSAIEVRLGTSGGIQATSYNSAGGVFNYAAGTGGVTSATGYCVANLASTYAICGHMIISLVSGSTWVSSHAVFSGNSGTGGGTVTLSGTLDRIRITTVNGTDAFDAGSVNILYEG